MSFINNALTTYSLCAKMGTIKDRNGKDLIEAERFKNGWQEYTDAL